jgi:predicted lipoprotein with Yx(FWY)xxD motif
MSVPVTPRAAKGRVASVSRLLTHGRSVVALANPNSTRGGITRRHYQKERNGVVKRYFLILSTVTALMALTLLSAAFAAGNSQGARVSAAGSSLGKIIVDARGRSLYLFEKDQRGRSACSGSCAMYWPPLITREKPVAGRGLKQSLLGTIRRANGSRQVTYAGHPLYRYVLDTRAGQTNGEGLKDFGGGWDVLSAAGKKIEGGSDG